MEGTSLDKEYQIETGKLATCVAAAKSVRKGEQARCKNKLTEPRSSSLTTSSSSKPEDSVLNQCKPTTFFIVTLNKLLNTTAVHISEPANNFRSQRSRARKRGTATVMLTPQRTKCFAVPRLNLVFKLFTARLSGLNLSFLNKMTGSD